MARSRFRKTIVLVGTMTTWALMSAPVCAQPRRGGNEGADMQISTQDTGEQSGAPAAEGPPSEALVNALRLYQQERYQEAAVQFQRVVEGGTGDAPANVQKAQFHLAKCLYHLQFYQSALAVFDEIIERGGNHAYFPSTLQ